MPAIATADLPSVSDVSSTVDGSSTGPPRTGLDIDIKETWQYV